MAAVAVAAHFRLGLSTSLVHSFSPAYMILRYIPVAGFTGQWWQPKLPTLAAALPAISLNIPGLLKDVWEGILRAVPKKKTSYSKTRSRQMAGKALKDVTSLCKCPSCGRVKRMHVLCEYCAKRILEMWRNQDREDMRLKMETDEGPAGR
ncbi:hypothetical protein MKZ38_010058 [Zalerion maritima]|uniref:Large ribosomal subunit protein bL32m n=1 Tax=Zalerion maritima TaxID=339359 RepID=A0AAD5RFM9_9PEZI|nr:hypothetical protein MKZ38_010058 [Zalerion maritima]